MKSKDFEHYRKLLAKCESPEERAAMLEFLSSKAQKDAQKRFDMKKVLFDKQYDAFESDALNKVYVCSRRCLAEGTLVKTANRGLVPIEQITTEDLVFGVNKDGTVSTAGVLACHDNGERDTVKLSYGNEQIEATEDHVFLTYSVGNGKESERPIRQFYQGVKIVKKIAVGHTGVSEPEAYLIGYVQGNGCMTSCTTNQLLVSSDSEPCVKRCADILGCSYKKNHDDNYNWFILAGKEKLSKIYARFLGMKSFEKHINYSEVCRFDRDSKLSLLAGMLDSDGCLCLGDGGIVLSFGCQSKPTVETFSMLLRELFNADTTIRLDDRPKYKNGGVFEVKLKSSATIKIIMKALEGKLCRVHMQDAWWSLPEQRRIDRAGFTKTGVGRAKTYDISVDNETNLYLLGNGCVTHNSGKSTLIAADMLHTALHNPNTDQLYVGLTKGHAKKTISKAFLDMIKEYDLPCKMNSNTLEIKFKNGSTIYLEGAKDQAAIERFRGMKLFKAVLDEAQSFPPSLAMTLVSEIIQPALGDLCGSFVIAGTPDPLCQSVLFRAFKHEKPFNNFKAFTWNVTDNTKFPAFVNGKKTPETYLADVRERTGYKETDAGYRREYLGEFVEDLGSLAYGFNPKRDVCPVSRFDKHKEWKYIISGDVGFCDADALVVMAFSYEDSVAYVVESYSKSGQDLTSFMTKVKELRDKYLPIRTVIDPGGGGVKVVAELRARYSIQADVAEKYSPKVIGCGLVADEFRRERIKILDTDENELLITQLSTIAFKERYNRNGDKVRYVPDGDQVIGEKGKIGDDVADAFLYGFKLLRNYVGHEVDKLSPEEERARMVQEHKSLLIKKAMEDAQEKDRRFDRWF